MLVAQGEVGRGRADLERHAAQSLSVAGKRQRRPPRGVASRVPVQSWEALIVLVACRPAVGAASSISDGSTCPGRPDLGVNNQMTPPVGEVGQGVDQGVDEIAVVLTPPVDRRVDDVLRVLVLQLVAGQGLDGGAQRVVDVVVVAELLDHLPGPKTEPARQSRFCRLLRRGLRGRAHLQYPPRRSVGDGNPPVAAHAGPRGPRTPRVPQSTAQGTPCATVRTGVSARGGVFARIRAAGCDARRSWA